MTDNKNIKALENLHNRILNDASFLAKVNHGELSALFHIKRILECQDAEIERLEAQHREMCIGMKVLKKKAIEKFAERLKEKFSNEDYMLCDYEKDTIDNLVKEMVGDAEDSSVSEKPGEGGSK